MLKKIIFNAIISLSLLQAETVTQQPNNTDQTGKLEFEKVLKTLQEKKNSVNNNNLPTLPLETATVTTDSNFNVIGTVTIGNDKYCYLLVDSNHVIKASAGMTIKNKKIEEIGDFGITITDKSKNTSYLPILTNQVQESDIVFSNRENDKKQQN